MVACEVGVLASVVVIGEQFLLRQPRCDELGLSVRIAPQEVQSEPVEDRTLAPLEQFGELRDRGTVRVGDRRKRVAQRGNEYVPGVMLAAMLKSPTPNVGVILLSLGRALVTLDEHIVKELA